MTIEWLAGNRLRGTTAERPNFGLPSGSVGGWVELGRSTASGGETILTVSSLSDKRYYQVITTDHGIAGAPARLWRFNNDSGSNYARRVSTNGSSDSTSVSQTSHNELSINNTSQNISMHYISNLSGNEKLHIAHGVGGSSSAASVAPDRVEFVGKWANTSNAINRMDYIANSGSFSSGDELIVLGWDPADTHTSNFWEELASVDLSGGANSNLSSGTISAKKYLWVQYYVQATSGTPDLQVTFNNDTTSTYARRRSINGGSDSTNTSQTSLNQDGALVKLFNNVFIINNSSNEKLCIFHSVREDASGAANAPNRRETVGKWANTSNQITEIDLDVSSSTMTTSSYMRVWGAD